MSILDTVISEEQANLTEQSLEINRLLETNVEPNRLPEHLFVSNFLPFFCGERDPLKEPDFYVLWISIAGTPMNEVQIIDSNSGKPLFRVPPLNDTSIIKPDKILGKGSLNFSQVITMAKMYSNMTPIAGNNVLVTGLDEKYRELQAKSDVFNSNVKRWHDIFARYGKIDKQISNSPETTSSKPGAITDDDMEF